MIRSVIGQNWHLSVTSALLLFIFLSVAEHLIAQHSAIKMLHSRVKVILEYVKAVEAGEGRVGLSDEVRTRI